MSSYFPVDDKNGAKLIQAVALVNEVLNDIDILANDDYGAVASDGGSQASLFLAISLIKGEIKKN